MMLGLKGMLLTGGIGLIACLVLAFLWKSEQSEHEYTKRLLDGETRRANVATKIANENAAQLKQMAIDNAVAAVRDKQREQSNAQILLEKDSANLKLRKRLGALKNAAEIRPKVLERTLRAGINRSMREQSIATCRTNCASEDNQQDN